MRRGPGGLGAHARLLEMGRAIARGRRERWAVGCGGSTLPSVPMAWAGVARPWRALRALGGDVGASPLRHWGLVPCGPECLGAVDGARLGPLAGSSLGLAVRDSFPCGPRRSEGKSALPLAHALAHLEGACEVSRNSLNVRRVRRPGASRRASPMAPMLVQRRALRGQSEAKRLLPIQISANISVHSGHGQPPVRCSLWSGERATR